MPFVPSRTTLAYDEFTSDELGAFLREHSSWRDEARPEDWILFIIVAADRWFGVGNTAQVDLRIALAQTLMDQHVLPRYERTHRERLASILFDRSRASWRCISRT
jgi:hypothetical protein